MRSRIKRENWNFHRTVRRIRINVNLYIDLKLLAISYINRHLHQINSLQPSQNGRRFADDPFKCIFLNENVRISIKISLKFVPKGPINNKSALIQIMAWCRSGDKPLFEAMVFSLLTHICFTRPQWVNNAAVNNTHLRKPEAFPYPPMRQCL